MKITKARLKEIINEELERAMTPEESAADRRAAAAEMKDRIAQHQAGRMTGPEEVTEVEARLTAAYNKLKLFPEDPRVLDMIEQLELLLQDLQI
tara:strand:+ start:151 stop:432 length:282 start_codon:yes stop_codon:yes gene_type:complete